MKAIATINTILEVFPRPNKIINTGKNAILGTGKNKYTIGLIKLSSLSLTPISIPIEYPSIVVINNAISNLKRLAIRWVEIIPYPTLKSLDITSIGLGITKEFNIMWSRYQNINTTVIA